MLDRIRRELVIAYKQSADKKVAENILAFEDNVEHEYDYEDMNEDNVKDEMTEKKHNATCSAVIFMDKLFTQRNLYGTIKAICELFGSLELLE